MILTIIPVDNKVGVNNFFYELDLSACSIPANIHALQWYETEGEVEFINSLDRTKPQNELITELPVWANYCFNKWNEAKVAEETAIALALAEKEKSKN
jgi:hypothetical protein